MGLSLKGVLLFLVFIFPGLIFRRFFYQGEFTKQFGSSQWIATSLHSIIPGTFIHLVLFALIEWFYGFENIDITPLTRFYKFYKTSDIKLELIDFEFITLVVCYYFIIIFIAWLTANLSAKIFKIFKLDIKYKVLRFHNYWYYYFTGDIIYTREFRELPKGKVLLTKADVLVNIEDGKTRMYSGNISQYTINKDNSLQNIYLTKTTRWKTPENGAPYKKDIPGDCFIIPYSKVNTINLNYVTDTSDRNTTISWYSILIVIWLSSVIYILFTKK